MISSTLHWEQQFHSQIMQKEIYMVMYLPPNYDVNVNKRYPVLYMHDGQNLFTEIVEGSSVKWNVRETVDHLLHQTKIEEIIIVGIYNNENLIDEYSPSYMDKYNAGGKADLYAKCIVNELKPYIDHQFRR